MPTTSTPLKRAIGHAANRLGLGHVARSAWHTARRLRGAESACAAAPTAIDLDLPLALDQIKGRNFEVPGCGGFLLSGRVENLGDYFELGREVACFDTIGGLIESIRHWLANECDRAAAAAAGYNRTIREHTYVHRLCEIFARVGFPAQAPAHYLPGQLPLGPLIEIP